MGGGDLGRLRRELAVHDRTIARAVAARLRVARRIGEAKRRAGRPIRNLAVERQVLRRWAEEFESVGVPRDRAHAFARWLVEEAVRVQELAPGPRPGGHHRIVIVGGAGGMGRMLGDRFRALGDEVRVVDPAARGRRVGPHPVVTDLPAAARWATVVLIATPIRVAPSVYRTLWASKTRALIVDLLSVKAPVRRAIAAGIRGGFRVGSVHPLFGPSMRTVAGELVLVVDTGDRVASRRSAGLFRSLGAVIEHVPLARHDAWMAELQVLPRLAGLAFLLGHGSSALGRRSRGRVITPSYARQASVSARLVRESAELSYGIQAANPHARATLRRFVRGVRELERLLEGDLPSFARRLEALRRAAERRSRGAAPSRR